MNRVPFALLWLLVFTIPWENAIVLPGMGTLSRLIGAAALLAGAIRVVFRGRLRTPRWFLLVAALFVVWAGVTLFWSIDPEETRRRTQTYTQLALMAWLIWEVAESAEDQVSLLHAFVLGSWCIAGATIWSYLTGTMTIDRRYTAGDFNANDVALTLVLAMPMAWYLAVTGRRWLGRWFDRAYIPVALVALLLTASRGAFIAALVGLSLIPWSFGRIDWRSKLVLSGLVLASAIAIVALVPPTSWERLATTQGELSQGSIGFRKTIWLAGLDVAVGHPVVGVGAGTFPSAVAPALARPFAAHNAFLAVLVEQGIVGLTLFVGLFVTAAIPLWRPPTLLTRFRLVLLATLVIGVMPLNWEYIKTTWFVLGLLASQGALRERVRRVPRARAVYAPDPVPRVEPMSREHAAAAARDRVN